MMVKFSVYLFTPTNVTNTNYFDTNNVRFVTFCFSLMFDELSVTPNKNRLLPLQKRFKFIYIYIYVYNEIWVLFKSGTKHKIFKKLKSEDKPWQPYHY